MKQEAHPEKQQIKYQRLLFLFLLFAYPLVSFLWRRSYPLLTIEAGTLFAIALIASALFSVILGVVRQAIAGLLLSLLVTVSFMVQFNFLLEGVIICLVICLVLTGLLKKNFQVLGIPILAALILGALLDGIDNHERSIFIKDTVITDVGLPPVIHILLDAFAGTEGLPPYPATDLVKEELDWFFRDYGFQVFPRAYSRYSMTGDSMYSALNFKNDGLSIFAVEVNNRSDHVLESNAFLDSLEQAGYRANIYQTGHLDYCQSNKGVVDKCWQYDHPYVRSLRYVASPWKRVSNLAGVMLKQSTLLTDLFKSHNWFVGMGLTNHDPKILDVLLRDIIEEPEGRYFFSHVLLPHAPFAYLHDCSINYDAGMFIRYPAGIDEPIREQWVYEARTGMYYEQIECALISLRRIFDEMKRTNLFEKSFIVLHGDHGSLIGNHLARYRNREKMTPSDYRSNFSTLFAVKYPHGKYQVDHGTFSLGLLLEEFSRVFSEKLDGNEQYSGLSVSTADPSKLDTHVFLSGTYPLDRVDINIFDSPNTLPDPKSD